MTEGAAILEAEVARGIDWRDMVVTCSGEDFEISVAEPTLFVTNGPAARGTSNLVASTNELTKRVYVATTSGLLSRILEHGRRRIVDVRTIDAMVSAIEAIKVRFLLRRRAHSEVTVRTSCGRTLAQNSLAASEDAFTEPFMPPGRHCATS